MSDVGGNFISDKFNTFYKSLNIEQAFSLSYHHQSNGLVKARIKFVKCTLKKCFDSEVDPYIALLQIHMTPLGQGLSRPATLLFNCRIRSIMPIINRPPVSTDNDLEHYEVIIKEASKKMTKGKVLPKCMFLSP